MKVVVTATVTVQYSAVHLSVANTKHARVQCNVRRAVGTPLVRLFAWVLGIHVPLERYLCTSPVGIYKDYVYHVSDYDTAYYGHGTTSTPSTTITANTTTCTPPSRVRSASA